MPNGYTGKILNVDLTKGVVTEETLDEKLIREYIGGAGLAARLIFDRQPAGIDPLGSESILAFMAGLLGGTNVPSSARLTVCCKSPLTGGWGDASAGGHFAFDLKRAGFDGILFYGVSPHPVYLIVQDGRAALKDAAHLWGKNTEETTDIILEEVGDSKHRIACIGPFGESKSLIAAIMVEKRRAAARSGVGAVMGSKLLKAVVVKGSQKIPVADETKLNELRSKYYDDVKNATAPFLIGMKSNGTCGSTDVLIPGGATPFKNWSSAGPQNLPAGTEPYGKGLNKYLTGKNTCAMCPIGCWGELTIDGKVHHRPEYETIAAFGTMCLNTDLLSIIEANEICDRFGIDTISAGNVIAFAFECYERGIITKKDTDGIELTWGDAGAILQLLRKIVKKEGFGALLADGTRKAAERIGRGAEESAVEIGGQEPGYHDPRLWPARGTGYICDPTPGRHTVFFGGTTRDIGAPIAPNPELQSYKIEVRDYAHKGPLYGPTSRYEQIYCAAGICKFIILAGGIYPLIDYINAATGWNASLEELLTTGERIQTIRQLFNIREGIDPLNVSLPSRLRQPAKDGPLTGISVDFTVLRQQYYEGLGWDEQTGHPKKIRTRELGIGELAEAVLK